MLQVFAYDPAGQARLREVLEAPSLYEEFLRYLARFGHAIPQQYQARDWTAAHVADDTLRPVFERIYENTDRYWREYSLCEDLVDVETQFQLWRFRHMRTVMRVIGFKRGTGGQWRGVPAAGPGTDLLPGAVRRAYVRRRGQPTAAGECGRWEALSEAKSLATQGALKLGRALAREST